MQAARRASAGKRVSSSGLKAAWLHQQSGWATPVRFCVSIAHWFGRPHSGQRVASIAAGVVRMKSVYEARPRSFQGEAAS